MNTTIDYQPREFTLTLSIDKEGLLYLPGDSTVVQLEDSATGRPILSPVQRAVLVARLRAWADLLEMDES